MKNLNLRNIWIKLVKYCAFKKVLDSALGVYCDGETIFCVKANLLPSEDESTYYWKITDMAELPLFKKAKNTLSDRSKQEFDALDDLNDLDETDNTVIDFNDESQLEKNYELVAEKVHSICQLRNWKTETVALCLKSSDVTTEIADLAHIPKSKIANAAHYQISVTGDFNVNDILSSFMEMESGIWIEGFLKSNANKLTDIWLKNKMSLVSLTAMPDEISSVDDLRRVSDLNDIDTEILSDDFLSRGGLNALFAVKTLIMQTGPNFLINKVSELNSWNFKKITAAIILASLVGLGSILAIDFWNYRQSVLSLEYEKAQLSLIENDRRKQKFIEANLAELEEKNQIASAISKNSIPWRGLLIHLGTLKINGVWLNKIRLTEETAVEIDGEATDYETMANFVKILENDIDFFSNGIIIKSSEAVQSTSTVHFVIDLPL